MSLGLGIRNRMGRLLWPMSLGFIVLMLLSVGWWLGDREAVRRDLEMRDAIQRDAIHMAGTINPALVRQLTFTPADHDLPAYLRIRDQMNAVAAELSHGGIYSLALRDGRLRFGPETRPLKDPSARAPGVELPFSTQQYYGVFANATPVVLGPRQDEHGVWMTALAPVLDETGRTVVMVIGMDVSASEWDHALTTVRARPMIMTAVLALFLLVASALALWGLRRVSPTNIRVRLWVMTPSVIAVLIAAGMYGLYEYRAFTQDAHFRLHTLHEQAQEKWNTLYGVQVQSLRALHDRFILDEELERAWVAGDDRKLRELAAMRFDSLRFELGITQLFCIGPDGTCLARGHKPDEYGDHIERPTILLSRASGDDSWGTEVGSRGAVSLRYTRPWTVRGRLIGYLELGKTVESIVERFAIGMHLDAITVVHKRVAERGKIESGRRNNYIAGSWETFPDVVLVQSTLDALPPEVEDVLRRGRNGANSSRVFVGHLPGRVFACGLIPVNDPYGNALLTVITLNDVSREYETAWRGVLISYGFGVVLLGSVIALLWIVSGKIQGQLITAFVRLQQGESRLAQLAETSRTVTWEVNADGLFTYVSDVSTVVMGYPPADLINKMYFYDLHPEGGRKEFAAGALAAFAMKQSFTDLLNPVERKGGGIVWVSTNGIPLLGPAGELRGYQGTDTDVTARRAADEALRESESRMRAITESAQDGIIMIDPHGDISFWNPAAERIFGYTAPEVIGKNLHMIITPPRYRKAHRKAFVEFQSTGSGAAIGKSLEMEAIIKDGREIPVQLALSAVKLNDGWHSIGLVRDITKQRESEAEREAAHQELNEALVDLREANRALEDATVRANTLAGEAEAANIAKSQFLANMSHEIRTPMNGIIGMTGLLVDSPLNPEQRQFVDVIRTSSEALLALINDILDFSKIEAHKIELDDLEFNLHTTLEETTELLAVKAHEKDLNIVCLIDPDVPQIVHGDPGRLRQILLNLGGNAVKFTHEGGVTIHASLVGVEGCTCTVRFAITDSGVGIPLEKQAKLFTPFTQVDGSITRKYGGTGLGLAISKQLAELMGGAIGMESPARSPITQEKQRGSMFWFTVTFQQMEASPEVPEERVSALTGVRMLVVDDSEANRFLVRTLLHNWGCRAGEAINGEHALEVLEEAVNAGDPYRFAFMDLMMPGIDGAELGRRVKRSPILKDTHLILMTSLGEQGDRERIMGIGFAGYFTKPFRQKQLRDAVEAILAGRHASTEPTIANRDHGIAVTASNARILVAEDNPINQLVALKILAKLGYKADTVANGAEAVEAVESSAYDIILMDCQMPEMDGFEATRALRGRNRTIPIIAMTANAMKGDRELCIESGMNDYLSKPVKSSELAAMLERWLPPTRP